MNFSEWYRKNWHTLYRHGLWLRGGELNTLPPGEFDRRPFRALFARLSTYEDVASSFTHLFLYELAARCPDVFPDLAYLPPKSDLACFKRDNVPWLLGTGSKRTALDFDLIGFSNAVVQELLNLPSFLSTSGIPFSKSERMNRPDVPLLVLGGANALYSSCVTMGDPLVDGVFVGEDPAAIEQLIVICVGGKRAGKGKRAILRELGEVPGFFEPGRSANHKIKKNFIDDLNAAPALAAAPVAYSTDTMGSGHIQISEGCPCFCSFCAESWDRKPWRERSAKKIFENALRAKAEMGLDQIDLFSFNFNMHSGIYQILWDMVGAFRTVGMMSQRFDLLALDRPMVEFQRVAGKSSFTCGMEGISPRLRRYLHKNLSDDDLRASLGAIFKSKAREMKIFLIATGIEEADDFAAFSTFLDSLQTLRVNTHSSTRLIFSMTPLVRFPWTPLEFEDGVEVSAVRSVIDRAARCVRAAGFEFREAAELSEYWVSQVLVRASDPRVKTAMLRAVEKTGFVFYREITDAFRETLARELAAEGLDAKTCLSGVMAAEREKMPWAAIETGVKPEFLLEEFERARRFEEIDYCLGRGGEMGHCFHCGGCPDRHHVRDIVLSAQKRTYSLDELRARMKSIRESEVKISIRVEVGERCRGLPRRMAAVAVARALMKADQRLVAGYRGFVSAFWQDEDRPVWITGSDVFTFTWLRSTLPVLREILGVPESLARVNAALGDWGSVLSAIEDPSKWQPSLIEFQSESKCIPDRYLQARGMKFTLKKTAATRYSYAFVPQSVKKGIIRELSRDDEGHLNICRLVPGPKFDAGEVHTFMKQAFVCDGDAWVRSVVRVTQG